MSLLMPAMHTPPFELIEGKSENEAVGTVISEFGNLDELAETLGLNRQSSAPVDNRRTLTQDEARSFVSAGSRHAFLTALGVFLCIFSVVPAAACSAFHNNFLQTMGTVALFIIVACGVGIFIITNSLMNKYDYIKKHECIIDYATVGYVLDKKEQLRNISIVCRTLGIIMCIISFVPAAVFDAIPVQGLDDIGDAAMICIVSVGVFLIVFGSMAETSCKTLLALNGDNVAGSYVKKENKEVRYINNTATGHITHVKAHANVMKLADRYIHVTVGQKTDIIVVAVLLIYLTASFITFAWALTWVIWPVAAVIHAIFKSILKDDSREV